MAKRSKTKAPVDSNAPPPEKQSAGVYTMMLIISFLALTIGSVLLYLEMARYDFDYEADVPSATAWVAPLDADSARV